MFPCIEDMVECISKSYKNKSACLIHVELYKFAIKLNSYSIKLFNFTLPCIEQFPFSWLLLDLYWAKELAVHWLAKLLINLICIHHHDRMYLIVN